MSKRSLPRQWLKWLTPGIHVKRWLLVLFLGGMMLGLGFGLALLAFFRIYPNPPLESILTLGGSSTWFRAGLLGLLGSGLIGLAILRINQAIVRPLSVEGGALIDVLLSHHQRQRGARIVAIGGGTGLPSLLRGLKGYTDHLTAIVTVADDGGSSGRLRRDLGVLPPGDFRNNIAALARDEALMTQLFQYRFGEGGLEGHSFGNLFITALSEVTGSFEQALVESSRVLAIRGQVLPSTLANVTLQGDLREGPTSATRRVSGESVITEVEGAIERVFLQPDNAPAYPDAVKAILAADLLVVGPGSLFTSILPNLLVHGIAEAVARSRALKVYVCNVATQRGETEGFSVEDHVKAIEHHIGRSVFDVVLTNNHFPASEADANYQYVRSAAVNGSSGLGMKVISLPLVDQRRPWRHDSALLAQAVVNLLGEGDTPRPVEG